MQSMSRGLWAVFIACCMLSLVWAVTDIAGYVGAIWFVVRDFRYEARDYVRAASAEGGK
jgi:hypothetical protein